MKSYLWLTSLSYNSAIFYIGADNRDYAFFVLPTDSAEYENLRRQTEGVTSNDRNVTLSNSRIQYAYGTGSMYHEYGDLYLATDGFFHGNLEEIGVDGWPKGVPGAL